MPEENITDNTNTPADPPQEPSNIEKFNAKRALEAKKALKEESKAKDDKVDAYLTEAIEARKTTAPQYVLALIEGLDPQSQLTVLKAHSERSADPNTPSIPTPMGRSKDPLEEYMIYNQTNDKLEFNIPASVLMNPSKNKKLLGIE